MAYLCLVAETIDLLVLESSCLLMLMGPLIVIGVRGPTWRRTYWQASLNVDEERFGRPSCWRLTVPTRWRRVLPPAIIVPTWSFVKIWCSRSNPTSLKGNNWPLMGVPLTNLCENSCRFAKARVIWIFGFPVKDLYADSCEQGIDESICEKCT